MRINYYLNSLLSHMGDPAGTSVIFRDITSFKSIERARRRAVHHLSHELVTPLSVIETSLRKLGKNTVSDSSEGKSIQRIKRNLDRLKDVQAIVQEIVAPPQYQPENLQVDLAINEILDDLRKKCSHRSATLISQLEPIETDIIDPGMLGRIVQTLVKNAVENSPDEAQVIISLSKISSGILLRIEDHGIGIAASDREFIFKAFHHTQETDKYSTKKPFDFNAGGKGLELMHLNILVEQGAVDISFESIRCRYIPTNIDPCCGNVSICQHISDLEGCKQSGGTIFSVLFKKLSD